MSLKKKLKINKMKLKVCCYPWFDFDVGMFTVLV